MLNINVSAADLVKQSAAQFWYCKTKGVIKPLTPAILEGDEDAKTKSVSSLIEMRGLYQYNQYKIFYCIDEVQLKGENSVVFIEHKKFDDDGATWFIERSIIQVALYHSFALLSDNKDYYTAKFLLAKGYPMNYLNIDGKPIESYLMLNDVLMSVEVLNPSKIVEFYINKLKSTLEYHSAKEFDNVAKNKEYLYLEKYIKTS